MDEGLRKILNNPFLRENPFRPTQQFYSQPKNDGKNNQSVSYIKPSKQKQKYYDLSVNAMGNSRNSQSTMSISQSNGGGLKKKSNPFHRKYLISSIKQNEFDNVQFEQSHFSRGENQLIMKPQFLQSSHASTSKHNDYKQSHCALQNPTRNSQKCMSLNANPNVCEKEFITMNREWNKQNININSKAAGSGYLLSPRFPSVKLLDNLVGRASPQSGYKYESAGLKPQSQKHISKSHLSPNRYSKEDAEHEEDSHAEKDIDQKVNRQSEGERKQVFLPNDGQPKQVTVRGNKYYRSAVQLRITR